MNKKIIFQIFSFCIIGISCTQQPKLGKDSVEDVVKAMTLEEKARLVVGTSKMYPMPPPAAPNAYQLPPKPNGYDDVQLTFKSQVKVYGAAGDSYPVSALGVPSIVYADGPAGVRIDPKRENDAQTYYATAFPISTLLASSWDTDLMNEVGKAMGNEVLEYGIDILLAPGMNIHRNPLTGRNFEYYSEDPLLSGKMAAAMVNGVQSNGVGTSVKHFAANNQETYRNGINTKVDERTLREIYFKGFEIAIKESNPWTVMSSYNKLNGEYASESHTLLTKLLRGEWGYDGFVMTDWWAEHDPIAQMQAGNDLIMPGTEELIQKIIKAVQEGSLDESVLDRNVARILNVVQKTPVYNGYVYSNQPNLEEHAQVVRKAGSEGMVLLENKNQTLPIATENKSIALLGVHSYSLIVGGYGSGYVFCPHKIALDQGLEEAGFTLDKSMAVSYTAHLARHKEAHPEEHFWYIPTIAEMSIDKKEIDRLANTCDMAVLTIGRNSGEGGDRRTDKGDYYLNDLELELIKSVTAAFKSKGKKTVIVLNIGGVMEMTNWKDYPDAILLAWQAGQESGYSVADVLTGTVNPSGKLPMTFPKRYKDIPSADNFPMSNGNPSMVSYEEGIFIGYRYYNTFNIAPLYEFGYGLSYTQFEYSNLIFNNTELNNEISVSVTVKNIGKVAGKEAVQLYVSAPGKDIRKPAEELKAFGKTKLLQPGGSETLTFTVKASDLASFNPQQSAWVADAGIYTFKVGTSSRNIRLTGKIEKKEALINEVSKLYE